MFEKDFQYPFKASIEDISLDYMKYSNTVINWRKNFYSEFDEQKFIFLLK